jgi:hypothetical protein
VALAVGAQLTRRGISAVLTGGACVAIYTGTYVSKDADFVVQGRVQQAELDAALAELGFTRQADRYVHSASSPPATTGCCPFLAPYPPRDPASVTLESSSRRGPDASLTGYDASAWRHEPAWREGLREILTIRRGAGPRAQPRATARRLLWIVGLAVVARRATGDQASSRARETDNSRWAWA